MTTAMYCYGTPSLSVPQTQNTAPVLEFNCLYTHDVRRKQKRWQDGFLRFHTFNKRVMVYDVPRNFIGDTHRSTSETLEEGDTVMLEKDGVLVQVAERIGQTETDLTELINGKRKISSTKEISSSPVRDIQTPSLPRWENGNTSTTRAQQKHRSLNSLLGTSKGPLGKASFPTKSPFEERRQERELREDETPSKRRKIESTLTRSVTWTNASSRPIAKDERSPRSRGVDSNEKAKMSLQSGRHEFSTKTIDSSTEPDGPDKHLQVFSKNTRVPKFSPTRAQALPQVQSTVRSTSPAFTMQCLPPAAMHQRLGKPNRTIMKRVSEEDPSYNRQSSTVLFAENERFPEHHSRYNRSIEEPLSESTRCAGDGDPKPTRCMQSRNSERGRKLRIAAAAPKRKVLLCQDQLSQPLQAAHSTNRQCLIELPPGRTFEGDRPSDSRQKTQRAQLQQRLAKIEQKKATKAEDVTCGGGLSKFQRTIVETAANVDVNEETPLQNRAQFVGRESLREDKESRRVASKSNKPSLSKGDSLPDMRTGVPLPTATKLCPPLVSSTKPLKRAASLNITAGGAVTLFHRETFQKAPAPRPAPAPKPSRTPNPWSREAFDLFTWRPTGWDEEKWCISAT